MEASPLVPIQTIPALRISYAHRILIEISERGPLTLGELFAAVDDPEELFKSERQHKSPENRARHLALFGRRLGLLADSGNVFELTDLGRAYTDALDPTDPWVVAEGQAELLQGVLQETHTSDGALYGAALLLSLLATLPDDVKPTSEDAGSATYPDNRAREVLRPHLRRAQLRRLLQGVSTTPGLESARLRWQAVPHLDTWPSEPARNSRQPGPAYRQGEQPARRGPAASRRRARGCDRIPGAEHVPRL